MLQYSGARSNIKSGDALFWTCDKVRSVTNARDVLIQWLTGSRYYHAAIAWVISGRVFTIEAVPAGVRLYPLSRDLPVDWVSVPDYWTNEIEEFALAHIGDEYSQMECALAYLDILKNGTNAEWECAEFAGTILKMGKVIDDFQAVPQSVFEKLMEKGLKVETLA